MLLRIIYICNTKNLLYGVNTKIYSSIKGSSFIQFKRTRPIHRKKNFNLQGHSYRFSFVTHNTLVHAIYIYKITGGCLCRFVWLLLLLCLKQRSLCALRCESLWLCSTWENDANTVGCCYMKVHVFQYTDTHTHTHMQTIENKRSQTRNTVVHTL